MPPPLSYPALKLVLEYVELEKRIHLTSRSSFLQRIDKAIPVYAKYFFMQGNNLRLDKLLFAVEHNYRRVEDEKNGKLLMSYLKGRSSINVAFAVLYGFKTSQEIPVKLEFKVNKLTTYYCNFEVVLPMINSRSLPITALSIILEAPTNVDHEIVHSAKNVSFNVSSLRNNLICVEKLRSKSAQFEFRDLPKTDVVRIIKYWIQHGKEVGTEFSFVYFMNSDLWNMITNLQEEFCRSRGYLEEINEHCLSGFSIPLSSSSKLLVYGIRKYCYELVLKVV
ncbi:hypothetical protein GCK72_008011 [Caenorhabditis remanei]|uniref:F-box associated domain-containing protein n=1 Tax=Caenorhabditis remanei TaxID=31234 RepID=A0A6A5HIQ8_CAERE|nr:hypothetical protein GCK72_008011 [Caenorhabditis remanei]KAF1768050.1 hypothetical protein GCK72_008011 [Caenorhabditis remanei]